MFLDYFCCAPDHIFCCWLAEYGPAGDGRILVSDGKIPVSDGRTPISDGKIPVSGGRILCMCRQNLLVCLLTIIYELTKTKKHVSDKNVPF